MDIPPFINIGGTCPPVTQGSTVFKAVVPMCTHGCLGKLEKYYTYDGHDCVQENTRYLERTILGVFPRGV